MPLLTVDANVSNEISTAGIAFGDLVLRTGQAVAETQNKLNATSAASATALANTLVDMIAVQEKVYDDQGNLDHMVTHTRKLPLVNFIDPIFYQWSNVRLQGQFYANELASASSTHTNVRTLSDKSGQGGLFIILGGGRTTVDWTNTTTDTTTQMTSDVSYGRMRMNALLQPRTDVGVPKPAQVLRGPRLAIIEGAITDIHSGGGSTGALTARTMSILIQYNRRNGAAIAGKAISIETGGVPWSLVGGGTTNASGQLEILLRREFIDEDADTTPQNFIVTARVGMVTNSTTVLF